MSSKSADVNRSSFDRYSRLKALQPRTLAPAAKLNEESSGCTDDGPLKRAPGTIAGSMRLEELLGAAVCRTQHGEHLSLVTKFREHAPCTPDSSALHLLLPNAPQEVSDPGKWLFLDTETTGLSGGTGTYPFLIGLAWWEGVELKVEQLFMREHSEERSMLAAVAERVAERPVLVTFNGKSFDWPLLETRFRMTRTISPPPLNAHLDFLHPARNLWRLRLGSVKLSQLERHVLDWDRGDDLLSGEIPRIYLDFVRSGLAEPLLPVFRHNQMDMCGLAGLAGRILSILSDEKSVLEDGVELYGLSRICERRGQNERARRIYEQSIETILPKETDRAARAALARLAKRDGDFERARELWEGLLGNSREGYESYEQLAIYYEHEVRNIDRALAVTQEALAQLRRARKVGMIASRCYETSKLNFEHRRSRLERKAEQKVPNLFLR